MKRPRIRKVEVLQEQRFAHLSDKRFTAGAEIVIHGGGDDHTQVQMRVLIRGTTWRRSRSETRPQLVHRPGSQRRTDPARPDGHGVAPCLPSPSTKPDRNTTTTPSPS